MGLSTVPFHSSLLGKEVGGLKLTTGHVLFIGAVEVHGNGKLNKCSASLETLADEVGLTVGTAKRYRSDMIRVGVFEVLEADEHSGYIKSMAISEDVVDLLKDRKTHSTPVEKSSTPRGKIFQPVTEVATEVGDNNIEMDERREESAHMKPTALRQQLALIFRANDKTKTRSLTAIRKLQEQFDDDSIILAAARKMKARGEITFKDGTTWKADYFWFVNPERTDAVVKGILRVMKDDLTEEDVDPRKKKLDDWLIAHGYDLKDPMLVVTLQNDKEYQEYMWRVDNGKE